MSISSVISTVKDTWEALTPPDRTDVPYRQLDGRNPRRGTSGHRKFMFEPPVQTTPLMEHGGGGVLVEWSLVYQVRFDGAGLDMAEHFEAVGTELNLLARTLDAIETWPEGVWSVITKDTAIAEIEEGGDAVGQVTLSCLCAEGAS